MFLPLTQLDRIWNSAGDWLLSAPEQTVAVLVLLTSQAGLLGYATQSDKP
ncbi:MAG: hypothetical protein JSS49_24920 [Planctomycetes bacterium]|nr:hypothetical protein [Planctomycetota bacterium]